MFPISQIVPTEHVEYIIISHVSLFSGPPGPPGGVRVDEVTTNRVRVIWSHGTDNLSPISKYTIQYRDVREQQEWREASTCEYITTHHCSDETYVCVYN